MNPWSGDRIRPPQLGSPSRMTTQLAPSRTSARPVPLETVYRIEPCIPEPDRKTEELVCELLSVTRRIGRGLHEETALECAEAIRLVETRSSWLLEGIDVGLTDLAREVACVDTGKIERGQAPDQVHLALTLRVIDDNCGHGLEPYEPEVLASMHAAVFDDSSGFRHTPADDVVVGRHLPPSSLALGGFLDRIGAAYRLEHMPQSQQIPSIAAAHHRFAYVHPFADGNGRIGRLISRAALAKCGAGGRGLWSLSHALLRAGVDAYRQMLERADAPRRGVLDGRGNLSRTGLHEFVRWFLSTAIAGATLADGALSECAFQQRFRRAIAEAGLSGRAVDIAITTLMLGSFAPDGHRYRCDQDQAAIAALRRSGFLKPTRRRPQHLGIGLPATSLPRLLPRLAD